MGWSLETVANKTTLTPIVTPHIILEHKAITIHLVRESTPVFTITHKDLKPQRTTEASLLTHSLVVSTKAPALKLQYFSSINFIELWQVTCRSQWPTWPPQFPTLQCRQIHHGTHLRLKLNSNRWRITVTYSFKWKPSAHQVNAAEDRSELPQDAKGAVLEPSQRREWLPVQGQGGGTRQVVQHTPGLWRDHAAVGEGVEEEEGWEDEGEEKDEWRC